jgi:predicted hotdog family 3-hydroxylacyl-ACP dehydratase
MLGREEIAARIPHSGRMCLLDRVLEWDAQHIRCVAESHRDADHPLRERGGLPVWAGIEYAAQAAAVHGSLISSSDKPRGALLGKLTHVWPGCEWLDAIESPIVFSATLLHSDPAGGVYAFEARGDDALLLQGQFTLMYSNSSSATAR